MDSAQSLPKHGTRWSREETILAFDLYCRIPFRLAVAGTPEVQKLARLIGRTPSSVARKLGNFGAADPELARRGIVGLTHNSRMDREIWDEFHADWDGLVWEAHRLRGVFGAPLPSVVIPSGPSERVIEARRRTHQAFFRSTVLSSYERRCCVTGLPIPECLVASHIVPWAEREASRADPRNGLCLSATFDRLFDRGLMTPDEDRRVYISQRIREMTEEPVQTRLAGTHGQPILLPKRFLPLEEYLGWHREHVFEA